MYISYDGWRDMSALDIVLTIILNSAGIGIGALSTSVPMYQSESVPKNIRGATVSSYQLLITLGIWAAYMVRIPSAPR